MTNAVWTIVICEWMIMLLLVALMFVVGNQTDKIIELLTKKKNPENW